VSVSFLGPELARPTRSRRFLMALTWALAVAVAMLAVAALWAPAANAQEAVTDPPASTAADPPPPDPAPAPDPAPEPPVSEAPPADPEPPPAPPAEPPADPGQNPVDPGSSVGAADQATPTEGSSATRDETVAERTDAAPQRDSVDSGFTVIGPGTSPTDSVAAFPDATDFVGPVAPVPADAGAESWIWTAEGDAFIDGFTVAGSGGTPGGPSGGLAAVLLNSPSGAAAKLEAAQRKRHEAAEASAIGSSAPPGAPGSGSNSFFSLFSGGSGGGGAVLLWFLLGIIAVWRLVPPDLTKAFLSPMARWRPSAYVPPIELPG
jgi:hypothetical protein